METIRNTNAIAMLVKAQNDAGPDVRSSPTNSLRLLAPEAAARVGVKGPSP